MCIIFSFCLLALWSRHGTKTVVFVLSKRFGNTIGWSHIFFVRSKRQQSPLIVTRTKRPHYGLLNTSPTSVTMKKYRENGKSSMKSWYNASQKLILHFSFVCFNLEWPIFVMTLAEQQIGQSTILCSPNNTNTRMQPADRDCFRSFRCFLFIWYHWLKRYFFRVFIFDWMLLSFSLACKI